MKKRGITPLIAVVLLVGIAVVLATILMVFFQNLSKDQTDKAENNLFLGQTCINDVNLDYKSFSFTHNFENPPIGGQPTTVEGDATIEIKIANKADMIIEEFSFVVTSDTGETKVTTIPATAIEAYGTETFNLDYNGFILLNPQTADPDDKKADEIKNLEILVKKKIKKGDIEGYCKDDEMPMNIIYGNHI